MFYSCSPDIYTKAELRHRLFPVSGGSGSRYLLESPLRLQIISMDPASEDHYYTVSSLEPDLGVYTSLGREEAEALVLAYSTRPGTSEYQTGLAVDMDTMGSFTTDFAWTTEYYWLQENAWKFGFVLRFPSDKTEVTNNSFEPWHYRYVGRYHAKIMPDNGLCLEEYIARISN